MKNLESPLFGPLVILVSACEADVFVNGVELVDFGPSNGRCTTARSLDTSGCGWGRDIEVEVFDRRSGLPYLFPDGQPFLPVPNGCNREECRL